MSEPAQQVPDADAAFRVLTRLLLDDGALSPRAAVLLDFWGRAMGLTEETRLRLVHQPSEWAPPPLGALSLVERFLDEAPEEVRKDARNGLARLLGLDTGDEVPAPVCPVCKARGGERSSLAWMPPPGSGLGSLEGIRRSTWSCLGCHTLLECIDEFDGSHRSRQMRIRVQGTEVADFLQALRDAGRDPDAVTEVLVKAPQPSWLLERAAGAPLEIWSALGPARARLLDHPALAPEVYAQRQAVARLGPPPSAECWNALVRTPAADVSLLARLASLPGAPLEVRRALVEHPDPEVRYQAFQAPDVACELLVAVLKGPPGGDPGAILAVLDRSDVGTATLETALESGDPHVLYRVLRHPALNLILLEKARQLRRGSAPLPIAPSRVLHVYAPLESRTSAQLLARTRKVLSSTIEGQGWTAGDLEVDDHTHPTLGDDGSVTIVLARATQSRALVFLPPHLPGRAEDLRVERLVESITRALLAGLAQEVIELVMDEPAGSWEARVQRLDEDEQRMGGHGLPVPGVDDDPGRWLEFELFGAERALPHAGRPPDVPTPRLTTRPPYVLAEAPDEPRLGLWAKPPGFPG